MTERPILFSSTMVRAILDSRKTQTRRVVKPQPYIDAMDNFCWNGMNFGQDFSGPHIQAIASPLPSNKTKRVHCPYGKPGDRLWVRETWQHSNHPLGPYDTDCAVFYRADYLDDPHGPNGEKSPEGKYRDWRPSIHMPRAACRLVLEITGVRVERLNDCSEADALSEGVSLDRAGGHFIDSLDARHASAVGAPAVEAFQSLWDSINGAGAWNTSPWVWVIEFRRADK